MLLSAVLNRFEGQGRKCIQLTQHCGLHAGATCMISALDALQSRSPWCLQKSATQRLPLLHSGGLISLFHQQKKDFRLSNILKVKIE